jgi:hypothetical protein
MIWVKCAIWPGLVDFVHGVVLRFGWAAENNVRNNLLSMISDLHLASLYADCLLFQLIALLFLALLAAMPASTYSISFNGKFVPLAVRTQVFVDWWSVFRRVLPAVPGLNGSFRAFADHCKAFG